MLNFVHTFGATKSELRGKVELLAPSALCAGTTEGTCAEIPCISLFYKSFIPSRGEWFTPLQVPDRHISDLGTFGDDGGLVQHGASFGGLDRRDCRVDRCLRGTFADGRAGSQQHSFKFCRVCRLRGTRRSVLLRGDRGRHGLARGRRDLFLGDGSSFKAGERRKGSPYGRLGTLPVSCGPRCASPVPFFGVGSRRVFGSASLVLSNVDGLTLLGCRSCGASTSDKRNAGHGDPIPIHHELEQGWSAAESSPETVVNMLLQPRPYLRNSEGNVLKYL
jgi:hypothetical protein